MRIVVHGSQSPIKITGHKLLAPSYYQISQEHVIAAVQGLHVLGMRWIVGTWRIERVGKGKGVVCVIVEGIIVTVVHMARCNCHMSLHVLWHLSVKLGRLNLCPLMLYL